MVVFAVTNPTPVISRYSLIASILFPARTNSATFCHSPVFPNPEAVAPPPKLAVTLPSESLQSITVVLQ
jgi:hypothetical protein